MSLGHGSIFNQINHTIFHQTNQSENFHQTNQSYFFHQTNQHLTFSSNKAITEIQPNFKLGICILNLKSVHYSISIVHY